MPGTFACRQQAERAASERCADGEEAEVNEDDVLISRLNDELHEKDMKLTDLRLEALSSAHQLQQLRTMLTRMKVNGPLPPPSATGKSMGHRSWRIVGVLTPLKICRRGQSMF